MKLLYVPLTKDELVALMMVADRERRRPQAQAAVMLAEALAKVGALTTSHAKAEGGSGEDPLKARMERERR